MKQCLLSGACFEDAIRPVDASQSPEGLFELGKLGLELSGTLAGSVRRSRTPTAVILLLEYLYGEPVEIRFRIRLVKL